MCVTVSTIRVHGSRDNEVRAPVTKGSGVFHSGHHRPIRITKLSPDEETPLPIREALIGLTVCTIFSGELFSQQSKSRLAYLTEVAKALEDSGHHPEAKMLMELIEASGFYVFEHGTFEFV